jgi:hypothetical protein
VIRGNLAPAMRHLYREVGIFASERPARRPVEQVERLHPERIHLMRGGSLPETTIAACVRGLRSEKWPSRQCVAWGEHSVRARCIR